jgi:hypothetical protein
VNCTESSPSVSVPWSNSPPQTWTLSRVNGPLPGDSLRFALDVAAASLGFVRSGPVLPLAVQLPDLALVPLNMTSNLAAAF